MHKNIQEILLSEEQIRNRIRELGVELLRDYGDKNPVFICILKGAVVFYADMIRAFDAHCEMEFMQISSYQGTQSTGSVMILQDVKQDLAGRHVVILEDILDTGRSLQAVCKYLEAQGVASLKICAFLDKPEGRAPGITLEADYVGFPIPNAFVVGYGLDYDEAYRNLPYLGVLKPEAYAK